MPSCLNMKRLQRLPQRIKDLVFGYCRLTDTNDTGRDTPAMLIYLILLYFELPDPSDVFDAGHSHKDIMISMNALRIDCDIPLDARLRKNCYLLNTVSNGRHVWQFRSNTANRYATIGIIQPHLVPSSAAVRCIGYMLRCGDGTISKVTTDGTTKWYSFDRKYACQCWSGDEITMTLDFGRRSIGFGINGVEFHKAFDIEMNEYRATISCAPGQNSFSLISYDHQY